MEATQETRLRVRQVWRDSASLVVRTAPGALLLVALPTLAVWPARAAVGFAPAVPGQGPSYPLRAALDVAAVLQAGFSLGAAIQLTAAAAARAPQRLGPPAMAGVRSGAPLAAYLLVISVAGGTGLYLLLAPGVFLMTVMAVAGPAMVVEGYGFTAAFIRSWRLTRGFRWRTAACVTPVAVGLVLAALVAVSGLAANLAMPWFLAPALEAAFIAAWGVLSTVLHRRLLAAHQALALIDQAAAFD